jgi:hypothetical protein
VMAGSWLMAFRVHRLDEAEVIHNLRRVRQKFADPCAAFAVLLKLEDGTGQRERRGWPTSQSSAVHSHRSRQLLAVRRFNSVCSRTDPSAKARRS